MKNSKLASTWCAPVATATPRKSMMKSGMRKAGEQIVSVLRESGRRMMCSSFYRALPHVPQATVRVRLTQMSERGALCRIGGPKAYEYGLSTWGTT